MPEYDSHNCWNLRLNQNKGKVLESNFTKEYPYYFDEPSYEFFGNFQNYFGFGFYDCSNFNSDYCQTEQSQCYNQVIEQEDCRMERMARVNMEKLFVESEIDRSECCIARDLTDDKLYKIFC